MLHTKAPVNNENIYFNNILKKKYFNLKHINVLHASNQKSVKFQATISDILKLSYTTIVYKSDSPLVKRNLISSVNILTYDLPKEF